MRLWDGETNMHVILQDIARDTLNTIGFMTFMVGLFVYCLVSLMKRGKRKALRCRMLFAYI